MSAGSTRAIALALAANLGIAVSKVGVYLLTRSSSLLTEAIHSFAEYLVPCAGRPDGAPAGERETLLKVDGVHVSDLELGRGTSRTAFIQRITKITALGPAR